MSRWEDSPRRNRGKEEVAADRRRRWRQERERSKIDRDARNWSLEDQEVVIPDGTDLRPAPASATLGDVLGAMVKARGWEERLLGADLEGRWAEVVGEQLALRSSPGRLAGGVLQILVDSPQWAAQLSYMTDTIAGRVAAVTGREVRDVVVVVSRDRG
ncbi:MAG: putative nucleic acid-binding Zn ribbon protein [Nitriliruptoraceae bacterium]